MSSVWKYVLIGVGVLGLCGVLAVGITVFVVTRGLPGYEVLAHYEPPVTTRVYAGNGTLIGEYARERRLFVPIEQIPPLVKAAFLSSEDKNFYSHPGIDIFSIVRALINNVRYGGRPQGASTITQQVARNFLLSSEVTYTRKIREAVLAMRIDSAYSKDEILELYLNEIFMGANSYGVAAATTNYFDKSLDELTIPEAAYLAALPRGPANYHPVRHKEAAIVRRNWVIDQMQGNGYLTREVAELAKAADLVTYTRPFGAVAEDVDYFVEEVRRFLYAKYGEAALYDGGLQVRSTLDTRLQDIAVRSLRNGLIAYDRRHGWRGPLTEIEMSGDWATALSEIPNLSGLQEWRVAAVTATDAEAAAIGFPDGTQGLIPLSELTWAREQIQTWLGSEIRRPSDAVSPGDVVYVEALSGEGAAGQYALRQVPEVNGAIIAIDPFNSHIRAMTGGFSFGSSEFNRAMQAMRQPGSTFKPFVYAAALDNGFTPVSKVLDAPFAIEQGEGLPLWTP
ncbi:MAG: transglycosylase domain-containing protein, partial [Proteobacteria bacterium]|nr:transglycosylase domain-containing protein [Pseudomonadota bacterium]